MGFNLFKEAGKVIKDPIGSVKDFGKDIVNNPKKIVTDLAFLTTGPVGGATAESLLGTGGGWEGLYNDVTGQTAQKKALKKQRQATADAQDTLTQAMQDQSTILDSSYGAQLSFLDESQQQQLAALEGSLPAQLEFLRNAMQGQQGVLEGSFEDQMGFLNQARADQTDLFGQQQAMLSPFIGTAQNSVGGMEALSGMRGQAAQQQAIDSLQNSPMFQAKVEQAEDAMLQNASATGGLRGGNTQAALAQLRPQMLQGEVDQQYNRLGGLANLGMGAVGQSVNSLGQAAGAAGAYGANAASLQGAYGNNMANILGSFGSQAAGAQNAYDTNMANILGSLGSQKATAAGNYGSNMANIIGGHASNTANLQSSMGNANAANQLAQYQLQQSFITDLLGLGLQGAGLFV